MTYHKFIHDVLKINVMWDSMYKMAQDIIEAFESPTIQNINVTSANSLGKTHTVATVLIYLLVDHPGFARPKVPILGPSETQLDNAIWSMVQTNAKLAAAYGYHNIEITQRKIFLSDHPDAWILKATPQKRENIMGVHSSRTAKLMQIIEEASSIQATSWLNETLMGNNGMIVCISNPLTMDSYPYTTLNDPSFKQYAFSALDHPNVVQQKQVIPGAVSPDYPARMEKKFGKTSSIYKARVLGEWSAAFSNKLITPQMVREARDMTAPEEPYELWMGVDVARFGSNSTVLTIVRAYEGDRFSLDCAPIAFQGADLTETADAVYRIAREKDIPAERITTDATGLGVGVVDILQSKEPPLDVTGINFSSTPQDEEMYENCKAEMYFNVQETMKNGKMSFAGHAPEELESQLLTLSYSYGRTGKLIMASKRDEAKNKIESQDYADSLALALYGKLTNSYDFLWIPKEKAA